MKLILLDEARAELKALPPAERSAMAHALDKLDAASETLGYPHTSAIRGSPGSLRELRPRRGRSPWRAFYRRERDGLVVAGIGPEAAIDPQGFGRAVRTALARLQARAESRARDEDE